MLTTWWARRAGLLSGTGPGPVAMKTSGERGICWLHVFSMNLGAALEIKTFGNGWLTFLLFENTLVSDRAASLCCKARWFL